MYSRNTEDHWASLLLPPYKTVNYTVKDARQQQVMKKESLFI